MSFNKLPAYLTRRSSAVGAWGPQWSSACRQRKTVDLQSDCPLIRLARQGVTRWSAGGHGDVPHLVRPPRNLID